MNKPAASASLVLSKAFRVIKITVLPCLVAFFTAQQTASAGSAMWNAKLPTQESWDDSNHWAPHTIPHTRDDTATFDVAEETTVRIDDYYHNVGSLVFNPGASAYTITQKYQTYFRLSGSGVVNNSGIVQNFVVSRADPSSGFYTEFHFTNGATAGDLTQFTVQEAITDKGLEGRLFFRGRATAGTALINNAGDVKFLGHASAANATIINTTGAFYSSTFFYDHSTAGTATIVNEGASVSGGVGGKTTFSGFADAGNSTITCGAPTVSDGFPAELWLNSGNGGTARIILLGDAIMKTYDSDLTKATVGSLEGEGTVLIAAYGFGSRTLIVGTNNLSTTFSGILTDAAPDAGALGKIGTGTFTLTGANTYTGGTTIEDGELMVNNTTGSGTGTGAVQVRSGMLSGTGIIAGAVTVGNGNDRGAVLAPGGNTKGTLTVQSGVTFSRGGNYTWNIDTDSGQPDQLIINGVSIDKGALFSIADFGQAQLTIGTVLIVINNTAATPILGQFANLKDGATVTEGQNSFEVDYEGGDRNDLTLTVVP